MQNREASLKHPWMLYLLAGALLYWGGDWLTQYVRNGYVDRGQGSVPRQGSGSGVSPTESHIFRWRGGPPHFAIPLRCREYRLGRSPTSDKRFRSSQSDRCWRGCSLMGGRWAVALQRGPAARSIWSAACPLGSPRCTASIARS